MAPSVSRILSIRKVLRFFCRSDSSLRRELSTTRSTSLPPSPKPSRSTTSHLVQDVRDPDHPFYNYTGGRWLYNEHLRLPERRLHIDIHALSRVVAKSVDRSDDDIVLFTKLAEGGSYRIFEATFKDGLKVIARLPFPCTVPRRYGVASEVATMEFLRLHGVPTPKVFDWSSSKSNEVGSEYIIMERAQGKELESIWYTMTIKEKLAMIGKIVEMERILFSIKFPASGSLYFKDYLEPNIQKFDIPPDGSLKGADKFCIGPSTELLWWYQKRDELDVSKGPWDNTGDVLKAVGQRELAWLQRFGQPRYPREPLYREFYGRQKVDPRIQMKNLSDYLKVAPYLVPEEQALNKPTIRHPDLSPTNIFISDSGDITSMIDWQHCTILPIFLQAKIPTHFQNYGDDDSENFRRPKLPDDFDSLTESEKEAEQELYRRRQNHYIYLGHTSHKNKLHFHAMGKGHLVLRSILYNTASQPWDGDNTSLKAQLIRTAMEWPDITASSSTDKNAEFPINYSESEIGECLQIDSQQKEADAQMSQFREFLGINDDGWVATHMYDEAVEKARTMKSTMLQAAKTEEERRDVDENWPFQDHEEVD